MNADNRIGLRIAQFRLEKNMTRKELSDSAGVSHRQIIRIESGETKNPSSDTLNRLATTLGVSLDAIMRSR